jgi:hypothetical protein
MRVQKLQTLNQIQNSLEQGPFNQNITSDGTITLKKSEQRRSERWEAEFKNQVDKNKFTTTLHPDLDLTILRDDNHYIGFVPTELEAPKVALVAGRHRQSAAPPQRGSDDDFYDFGNDDDGFDLDISTTTTTTTTTKTTKKSKKSTLPNVPFGQKSQSPTPIIISTEPTVKLFNMSSVVGLLANSISKSLHLHSLLLAQASKPPKPQFYSSNDDEKTQLPPLQALLPTRTILFDLQDWMYILTQLTTQTLITANYSIFQDYNGNVLNPVDFNQQRQIQQKGQIVHFDKSFPNQYSSPTSLSSWSLSPMVLDTRRFNCKCRSIAPRARKILHNQEGFDGVDQSSQSNHDLLNSSPFADQNFYETNNNNLCSACNAWSSTLRYWRSYAYDMQPWKAYQLTSITVPSLLHHPISVHLTPIASPILYQLLTIARRLPHFIHLKGYVGIFETFLTVIEATLQHIQPFRMEGGTNQYVVDASSGPASNNNNMASNNNTNVNSSSSSTITSNSTSNAPRQVKTVTLISGHDTNATRLIGWPHGAELYGIDTRRNVFGPLQDATNSTPTSRLTSDAAKHSSKFAITQEDYSRGQLVALFGSRHHAFGSNLDGTFPHPHMTLSKRHIEFLTTLSQSIPHLNLFAPGAGPKPYQDAGLGGGIVDQNAHFEPRQSPQLSDALLAGLIFNVAMLFIAPTYFSHLFPLETTTLFPTGNDCDEKKGQNNTGQRGQQGQNDQKGIGIN